MKRGSMLSGSPPFPDLKGQAPLRHRGQIRVVSGLAGLFLTSKVRLHCDDTGTSDAWQYMYDLFLTSKVRLHCDERALIRERQAEGTFS